jgi:hypothetical protein
MERILAGDPSRGFEGLGRVNSMMMLESPYYGSLLLTLHRRRMSNECRRGRAAEHSEATASGRELLLTPHRLPL